MLDPEGQYLQHVRIYYERYADDMLFDVARTIGVPNTRPVRDKLRTLLMRACDAFNLQLSWIAIDRFSFGMPSRIKGKLRVLGLVLSLSRTGHAIPMIKWKQKLSWPKIEAQLIRECFDMTMKNFLKSLIHASFSI